MKEQFQRKPRFNTNDHVRIVGPGAGKRTHHSGVVSEVLTANTASIIRYRVSFPDGSSDTYFGFELELIKS